MMMEYEAWEPCLAASGMIDFPDHGLLNKWTRREESAKIIQKFIVLFFFSLLPSEENVKWSKSEFFRGGKRAAVGNLNKLKIEYCYEYDFFSLRAWSKELEKVFIRDKTDEKTSTLLYYMYATSGKAPPAASVLKKLC